MATLDVDALLASFINTEHLALSESTLAQYQSRYKIFQQVVSQIPGTDPVEPVTLKNLKIFLAYRKQTCKSYNTILADIASIRYFCQQKHFEDVTKNGEIKLFKKGLKRLLQAGQNPHAAVPLQKQQLIQIFQNVTPTDIKTLSTLVFIIIQYYAIMRISEVLSLTTSDITIFSDDLNGEYIQIKIGKTKRDQEGIGRTVFIFCDHDFDQNVQYIKELCANQPAGFLFPGKSPENHLSATTIRRRFYKILDQAGIEPRSYKPHSLRKGGAQRLAEQNTPPEAIRYQGGWKSTVFLEYTKFDSEKTARAIKDQF